MHYDLRINLNANLKKLPTLIAIQYVEIGTIGWNIKLPCFFLPKKTTLLPSALANSARIAIEISFWSILQKKSRQFDQLYVHYNPFIRKNEKIRAFIMPSFILAKCTLCLSQFSIYDWLGCKTRKNSSNKCHTVSLALLSNDAICNSTMPLFICKQPFW